MSSVVGDWAPVYDEGTQLYYYYNQSTGETTWDPPAGYSNVDSSSLGVASLPTGWVQIVDEGSGTAYFYNEQTGETTWDPPGAPAAPYEVTSGEINASITSTESTLPNGWTSVYDESSGQTYYFHAETGETSWEVPAATSSSDQAFADSSATNLTSPAAAAAALETSNSLSVETSLEWIEHIDGVSGKVYYENTLTRQTQWDSPDRPPNSAGKDDSMSLYSSSNLHLPTFPNVSLDDNRVNEGNNASNASGRNKRSGYVIAPEDFNEEYINLGKKKSSSGHSGGGNSGGNNNNNSSSSLHSSASGNGSGGNGLPEHDFSTEEWGQIVTKIDSYNWNESNPLKVSEYLLALPSEYYQSIHVILYIAKKLNVHFTFLKFAEHYFQYDRRVSSATANASATSSSTTVAPSATTTPATSTGYGTNSRNNSVLNSVGGKESVPIAAPDKAAPVASPNAPAAATTGNNNQILTNMLEKLISHQSEPIKTSLTVLSNHSLVNEAINSFKQIQSFMTVNTAMSAAAAAATNIPSAAVGVNSIRRRRSTIIFTPPSSSNYPHFEGGNNGGSSGQTVNYYEIALHLLQIMLITSYEELQDEIYIQICKQIKRNPQIESIELGYQLLLILLSSIPPSKRLIPYLLVYLANNIEVITASEAKKFAIYSIKHVLLSFLSMKRKELPTIYELQRLLLGEKMNLHILCIDYTILQEYIDSYTTVKDLEKLILARLKILPDHSPIFGLFEGYSPTSNVALTPSNSGGGGSGAGSGGGNGGSANTGSGTNDSNVINLGQNNSLVNLLSYHDRIVDILSRWEKVDHIRHDIFHDNKELAHITSDGPSSDHSNTGQSSANHTTSGSGNNNNASNANNGTSNSNNNNNNYYSSSHHNSSPVAAVSIGYHYFIWKVNYYFPLVFPEKDYHAKRLIYYQGIHDVITSYYPHSLQDALFLAALQLQIKYGDYVIGKEIKELRSSSLFATILSPLWFQSSLETTALVPSSQSNSAPSSVPIDSATLPPAAVTHSGINRSDIETKIIALYKKLQHISADHAIQLFLSYIQTWKLYGAKYFHVKGQITTNHNTNNNNSTGGGGGGNNYNNNNFPSSPHQTHRTTAPNNHSSSSSSSSSEKNLILAITLNSVIIIDVASYHFLADYHYEQIYSCGHTFESFVLIIGTKANQVKSYYRTNQGKEIEEILRIYLSHHKNIQSNAALNSLTSPSPASTTAASGGGSLSIEVSN